MEGFEAVRGHGVVDPGMAAFFRWGFLLCPGDVAFSVKLVQDIVEGAVHDVLAGQMAGFFAYGHAESVVFEDQDRSQDDLFEDGEKFHRVAPVFII